VAASNGTVAACTRYPAGAVRHMIHRSMYCRSSRSHITTSHNSGRTDSVLPTGRVALCTADFVEQSDDWLMQHGMEKQHENASCSV
jgi:hypothetical protein